MTVDQRFTVTIALIGLLGALLSVTLRSLINIVRKWTTTEDKLDQVIKAVEELAEEKEKIHEELYAQMRRDADATNQRLTWLEHNLWKRDAN
jgi:formiminotetrahydrofolate cyclodeaminase